MLGLHGEVVCQAFDNSLSKTYLKVALNSDCVFSGHIMTITSGVKFWF